MKRLTSICLAFLLIGCAPKWTRTPGPDIKGTNALTSVTKFIATNGWNMYGTKDTIYWDELEPKAYISDLPWKAWAAKQFQAKTSEGILYILLGDNWHNDYYGIAYNPSTNHFPKPFRWFKPIGDHWYAWSQPEFWYQATTEGRYE